MVKIAQYYAAWYNVKKFDAILENNRYTFNRKKATLFVQRLGDIWERLTEKQKERKINDAGTEHDIKIDNLTIKNASANFNMSVVKYDFDGLKETLSDAFDDLKSFSEGFSSGQYSSGDGLLLLAYETVKAGGTAIGKLAEHVMKKIDYNHELKRKIERKVNNVHKKILTMNGELLKVDLFCKRADEVNISLEKAMEAYETQFIEVNSILFPDGDVSKTKEARAERKQNGGTYFTDEEADKVVLLRTTGQLLLNLVDAQF